MSSATATAPPITYWTLGIVTVDITGNYTPNYNLIVFYVISILITANICAWLWGRGQTIASMAVVPMFLLVFIFFGLRWFPSKTNSVTKDLCQKDSSISSPNIPFPPIVNMCPDFMTAWTDTRNDKVYCYDANNTYNMKDYKDAGLEKDITINGVGGQSAYLLFDPAHDASDAQHRWPLYYLLDNNLTTITNDARGKFLRWEGILESQGSLYTYWKYNMMRILPGISGQLTSI
jgi:hypothetical protein